MTSHAEDEAIADATEATAPRPTLAASSVPRIVYAVPGERVRTDVHPIELRDMVAANNITGTVWVDIDTDSRHQVALLEKVFDFHPLAV